jgi:hypothetical protein
MTISNVVSSLWFNSLTVIPSIVIHPNIVSYVLTRKTLLSLRL